MKPTAEQLLIDQIRQGDPRAWEACIAQFEGRLLAFVSRRLGDTTLAEDIVQETFLGFLTSLPNFEQGRPLEPFLFSIAAHKITDELRRQGRRPTVSLPGNSNVSGSSQPNLSLRGQRKSLAGSGRTASRLLQSKERMDSEQNQIAKILSDLIQQWKREGNYQRLMCVELLFVRGVSNKLAAEILQLDEQTIANHKQFVMQKLKQFVQ